MPVHSDLTTFHCSISQNADVFFFRSLRSRQNVNTCSSFDLYFFVSFVLIYDAYFCSDCIYYLLKWHYFYNYMAEHSIESTIHFSKFQNADVIFFSLAPLAWCILGLFYLCLLCIFKHKATDIRFPLLARVGLHIPSWGWGVLFDRKVPHP